jgi:hypothetical protein
MLKVGAEQRQARQFRALVIEHNDVSCRWRWLSGASNLKDPYDGQNSKRGAHGRGDCEMFGESLSQRERAALESGRDERYHRYFFILYPSPGRPTLDEHPLPSGEGFATKFL